METLLHYVWKYKLYNSKQFQTIGGSTLEILDPGILNSNAGPDFFNAKVKINEKIWAGNIEIHSLSSDWYKHKHHLNKAYNSVILHVVEFVDDINIYDESNRLIPQWIMSVPSKIKENYYSLLTNNFPIPCLGEIKKISKIYINDWKEALLMERLVRKSNHMMLLLEKHQENWEEVFYITLARNFGFGINNDAFERLAQSLPLKYINKHKNSIKQLEALFLGQAGLLDDSDIENDYYNFLQKEYIFLRKKYNLKKLEHHIFKNLRIRPNNFPHIKIIQLVAFIQTKQKPFSYIIKTDNLKDLQKLFICEVSNFWKTHYHFRKASVESSKTLGLSSIDILLINTVIPLLLVYGIKKNQEYFLDRAIHLLESIKPENNYIVHLFRNAGIEVLHASDSQALIQLKKEYCDLKKCIFCRIGHKLLSK